MVLSIMVPHFPDIGSGGMPLVPQTILMSDGTPFSAPFQAKLIAVTFLLFLNIHMDDFRQI